MAHRYLSHAIDCRLGHEPGTCILWSKCFTIMLYRRLTYVDYCNDSLVFFYYFGSFYLFIFCCCRKSISVIQSGISSRPLVFSTQGEYMVWSFYIWECLKECKLGKGAQAEVNGCMFWLWVSIIHTLLYSIICSCE